MNYKKLGVVIIGIITAVLVKTKDVFAQVATSSIRLEDIMTQTGYGPFTPPPVYLFLESILSFVFFPIIIIVWLIGLVKYIRRKNKNTNQLPVDPSVYKRQLIRLVVWSVILILIFLEAYFVVKQYHNDDFGPYDIQNLPTAVAGTTAQIIAYLFIFLIIPKIIIKIFLYFKSKRNSLLSNIINKS